MRVFVTGATGFVGSAVVRALVGAGHEVVGLVRSEAGQRALEGSGAVALRGSVEDDDTLRAGVDRVDAVIHTAFNHDFSKFKQSCESDGRVIAALGAALEGSARPLIVTSPLGILPRGVLVSEETAPLSGPNAHPRAATEAALDAIVARGVRATVVRLPPTVHGKGDPHFVKALIELARVKGKAAFIGEGANRWPAVHRLDAALVYRLVLERGFEPGTRFHAVAEEGVMLRDIATAIGRGLGVGVGSEAPTHFGGIAGFVALDLRASSTRTRQTLDWHPTHPDLLADLALNYFGT
jgi:nucleoside-diphosphate-sugar epimerase